MCDYFVQSSNGSFRFPFGRFCVDQYRYMANLFHGSVSAMYYMPYVGALYAETPDTFIALEMLPIYEREAKQDKYTNVAITEEPADGFVHAERAEPIAHLYAQSSLYNAFLTVSAHKELEVIVNGIKSAMVDVQATTGRGLSVEQIGLCSRLFANDTMIDCGMRRFDGKWLVMFDDGFAKAICKLS